MSSWGGAGGGKRVKKRGRESVGVGEGERKHEAGPEKEKLGANGP